MSATEEAIIEFLVARAGEAWQEEQPYLLSLAGSDFANAGIDYQETLGGERLKNFVERTSGEGRYRFVKHPEHKAKIGIVPYDAAFEFVPGEDLPATSPAPGPRVRGSILLEFLDALSKLPADDLNGVVIPTRVLVKLARKQ